MLLIRFLKSRIFVFNLAIAALLVCGFIWAVLVWIDDYSMHGEAITVPDLHGYTIAEADSLLEQKKLRFEIMDSVYDNTVAKGTVVSHNPQANTAVKQNRTIYLVVNAMTSQKIKMPNLIDLSLRQAISMIESSGLRLGILEYVPDIAQNAVIDQKIKGKEIQPGTVISKGATIDLVLGDGLSDETRLVPNLMGMAREEAITLLRQYFLNEGERHYEQSVFSAKDSLNAKVYKQNPSNMKQELINPGGFVDLWYTINDEIFVTDSIEVINNDSIR